MLAKQVLYLEGGDVGVLGAYTLFLLQSDFVHLVAGIWVLVIVLLLFSFLQHSFFFFHVSTFFLLSLTLFDEAQLFSRI